MHTIHYMYVIVIMYYNSELLEYCCLEQSVKCLGKISSNRDFSQNYLPAMGPKQIRSYPTKTVMCKVFNNFHKPCEIVTTNVFSSFQLCRTISPSSYVLLHFACLLGEARKLYCRESSPYANFITSNFITAIFQNIPEIFS